MLHETPEGATPTSLIGRLRMEADEQDGERRDCSKLLCEAASEIDRLRAIIENVALAVGHNDSPLLEP